MLAQVRFNRTYKSLLRITEMGELFEYLVSGPAVMAAVGGLLSMQMIGVASLAALVARLFLRK
jgi:hypothetical protein